MALEEEFAGEISDEDAEQITTVQKAIDYVKSSRIKSKHTLCCMFLFSLPHI